MRNDPSLGFNVSLLSRRSSYLVEVYGICEPPPPLGLPDGALSFPPWEAGFATGGEKE